MPKLLALVMVLLFSAHVAAASRDFQLVCPCEVELKSDSLAQVSFSLARLYENTSIDSIEVYLIGNDEEFVFNGSQLIGSSIITDLPSVNNLKSYQLLIPTPYFIDSTTYTEIHLYTKEDGNYKTSHVLALANTLGPSRNFGYSYNRGELAFSERPTYKVTGNSIEVSIPPIINLGGGDVADLAVIVAQEDDEAGFFYRLNTIAIGDLLSGSTSLSNKVKVDIREEDVERGFNDITLFVVTLDSEGALDTFYVKDLLFDIGSPSVALENLYASAAPQIFSDANANRLSDYNEQLLGLTYESITDMPPWEINVATFVTENALTVSSNARARAEHLFAHTNNIFELSGVAARLVLSGYSEVGNDGGALISGGEVDQLDLLREFQTPFEQAQIAFEDQRSDVIMSFAERDDEDSACGLASGRAGKDQNKFNSKETAIRDKFNFFIVGINCPDSVLAHEFGHIAGLGHSRAQKEVGIRGFAVGHGIPSEFVTIMPYQSEYDFAPEVELFSTPLLSQCGNGSDCGVDRADLFSGADAVFVLNQTIPHIAAIKNGYPPTLSLSGGSSVILDVGEDYEEAGYRAHDVEDGELTEFVIVDGSVDSKRLGNYKLTYSVADSDNNRISITREIEVIADSGSDGIPDAQDSDLDGDGDGYLNLGDLFPDAPTEWFDSDADGIGDNTDENYNPESEREFLLVNRMDACDSPLDDDVVQWEINGVLSSTLAAGEAMRTILPVGDHVFRTYRNDVLTETTIRTIFANTTYIGWGCKWNETNYQDILDNYAISEDRDGDLISGSDDAFPDNREESLDNDGDGVGNNSDTDDDNDGYSDQHELEMGSDPLNSDDIPRSGGLSPALLRVISQEVIRDDGGG